MAQVVQHGGSADLAVTDETTQLVVLPQPDGAAVALAALLKAVARGEYGSPTLGHLRSRLKRGQLDLVSPKCVLTMVALAPAEGSERSAGSSMLGVVAYHTASLASKQLCLYC